MSCLFCKSLYHLSQYCNIYVSDYSRIEILSSGMYCKICCFPLNDRGCKTCYSNKKCFVCFTKTHHTVVCPDRDTVPALFCPNIDQNILLRFLQMLDKLEQYSIALNVPKCFKLLKITNRLKLTDRSLLYTSSNLNVVAVGTIIPSSLSLKTQRLIASKDFVVKVNEIIFDRIAYSEEKYSIVIFEEFLSLFSLYTKIVKIDKFRCTSKITLTDILQKAPNLVDIEFQDTNIELGKLWPDDLLKYTNGNNFQNLNIRLMEEFNVESFAHFVKTKCAKNVHIRFYIHDSYFPKFSKNFEEKFLEHFVILTSKQSDVLHLLVALKGPENNLRYLQGWHDGEFFNLPPFCSL